MSSETLTTDVFSGGESKTHFRGWVIFAGVASLVLGITAIAYDVTATLVSVVVFGWLMLVAGGVQIVNAFQVRTWRGFFLYLLDGIFRATLGALLVLYPGAGAQSLTLVLSFYFIGAGLFKATAASILRFPSWGWSVASAVVAVALGIMLIMQWPTSASWFIGFAVGVDLILYGWALLMFASAIRKLSNAFA